MKRKKKGKKKSMNSRLKVDFRFKFILNTVSVPISDRFVCESWQTNGWRHLFIDFKWLGIPLAFKQTTGYLDISILPSYGKRT